MGRKERERKARMNAGTAPTGAGNAGSGNAGSPSGRDADAGGNAVTLFADGSNAADVNADTRLLSRAIRERWPTTDENRAKIRAKLQGLILNGKMTNADQLAKLINIDAKLESQNQRDDEHYDPFSGIIPPSGASGGEGDAPAVEVNQIRFYIPSNGRGPEPGIVLTHGDDSNPAPKPKRTRKRASDRPPAG